MKTKFSEELEAAGRALYTRQAHQQGQMAAWQSLPHTIKEEYCLWAADVIRTLSEPTETMLEAVPKFEDPGIVVEPRAAFKYMLSVVLPGADA